MDANFFCSECGNRYYFKKTNGKIQRECRCCGTKDTPKDYELPKITLSKSIPLEKRVQRIEPVIVRDKNELSYKVPQNWDLKYDPF